MLIYISSTKTVGHQHILGSSAQGFMMGDVPIFNYMVKAVAANDISKVYIYIYIFMMGDVPRPSQQTTYQE